jgi:palmitoyltransferase
VSSGGDAATPPAAAAPLPPPPAAAPPAGFDSLRQATAALADGGPDLAARIGSAMGLTREQQADAADALAAAAAAGGRAAPATLSPESLQRALRMRVALAGAAPAGASAQACGSAACGHTHAAAGAPPRPRRTFLRNADAVLGPAYVALAAALFTARLLPFGLALWALPLGFGLAARLVLVRAAGLPAALLPLSRLPAGIIAALELAAVGTFARALLPAVADLWGRCFALAACSAAFLYFHYQTYAVDPGALPLGAAPPPALAPEALAAAAAARPADCLACGVYKPIRARHCSACGRCREEHDHHCPAVAGCVAAGNRREFLIYLLTLLAAELLWMSLALARHARALAAAASVPAAALPSAWAVSRGVFALGAEAPGTTYMTCLTAGLIAGTGYLAARQLFCVAAGLSVSELLLRQRTDYLKAADGSFFNPFDAGPAANAARFWRRERPDWYAIYEARRGLDPDAAAPPRSVTRLLRRWDAARAALTAARAREARRREEVLLRRFGGVRDRGGGGGEV